MRRLVAAPLLLLGGVLLVLSMRPATAQTCDDPALEADSTSVRAGDTITVTGAGFDPACAEGTGPHSPDVELTLVQGDATTELGTARATDDDPSLEADVDIPADADPGSATITAQGAAGSATLAIQVTVGTEVSPDDGTDGATDGDTTTDGATGGDDLADTGIEPTALVGLAFGLLLFGIGLEWVAQVLPARL